MSLFVLQHSIFLLVLVRLPQHHNPDSKGSISYSASYKGVFIIGIIGHNGKIVDTYVPIFLKSVGRACPDISVYICVSPFTEISNFSQEDYHVNVHYYFWGPKTFKEYKNSVPQKTPIKWNDWRFFAFYELIEKVIISNFDYLFISDMDILIFKNPFSYLTMTNTTEMIHMVSDQFPLTKKYSFDFNYKFLANWWNNRNILSNLSFYEPKFPLGADEGEYRSMAANIGTWFGKPKLIYEGMKIFIEIMKKAPDFKDRVGQGAFNYLKISGQLYEYVPKEKWIFHQNSEGTFITNINLSNPNHINAFKTRRVIMVHHWNMLKQQQLAQILFDYFYD